MRNLCIRLMTCGTMLVCLFLAGSPGWAASPEKIEKPKWTVGEWWDVEMSGALWFASEPKERWSPPQRMRYAIEGVCDVEGHRTYKVTKAYYSGSKLQPADLVYYLSVEDLSLVRIDNRKKHTSRLQTPGAPVVDYSDSGCWAVFTDERGKKIRGDEKIYEFRRADGTVRKLPAGETFALTDNPVPGPVQETSDEFVDWSGTKRKAVRAVVYILGVVHGERQHETHVRWVKGIDWPAQMWGATPGQGWWSRVVATSKGMPFQVPQPKVSGWNVVEGK